MNRRAIYGKAARSIREARNKSQAETAAAIGMTEDGYGTVERKQRDLLLQHLPLAAAFLRFDPLMFMNLTSEDPAKVLACLLPDEEKDPPAASHTKKE